MKNINRKEIIVLAFLMVSSAVAAQMPDFFNSGAGLSSGGAKTTAAKNASANSSTSSGSTSNTAGSEKTTGTGGSAKTQAQTGGMQQPATQPASSGVPVYDPAMDNHLKAPAHSEKTGLFGLTVKQVEEALRFQGAKNHSYAFGKYSRMTFSAYLITIFFDRERKVGGFLVEPRAPYRSIEPNARDYFMQTFLKGADLSKFAITVASDKLEVKFTP